MPFCNTALLSVRTWSKRGFQWSPPIFYLQIAGHHFFKGKTSDAFAILPVTGTLVEALQIKEQYFFGAEILSRLLIGRLIILNLLSRGRKVSLLLEKKAALL
jgi:hypothetical protein